MSTRLKAVDALNQFHFESHSSSRPYFMQGSTAFDSSPLEEEAWRGRVEGMVVGTIVGALGGGSAVALHGPLFAAVGAACSVM